MKQIILFEDDHEYNINAHMKSLNIHFDYETKYMKKSMQFPHFHPYYEIYFLLSGTSQHYIEGTEYNLEPYDFVLLKPYILHKAVYCNNIISKRIVLSFNLDFFNNYFTDASNAFSELFTREEPVFRLNNKISNKIMDIFNRMYKTSKTESPTADLLITSYFFQFLDIIYQERNNNEFFICSRNKTELEYKIQEVTSYIHKNYKENLTLNSIAAKFYISPHYLSRQYKIFTGFTLIQYIQKVRIKRAQELLLDTNMKIIDIIDYCGFGSIPQFNRVFNNLVKCSPSQYRNDNVLHV